MTRLLISSNNYLLNSLELLFRWLYFCKKWDC